MKLLYLACMHNPEDFEPWLIPHLKKHCEVYPINYRTFRGDINESLPALVKMLGVDYVLVMKGEIIRAETIKHLVDMGVPSACWTIDDHAHPEFYEKPYRTIFTPSPALIPSYHDKGFVNVHELAFYVEPTVFLPPSGDSSDSSVENDNYRAEVSFLGTEYPGRIELLTLLEHSGFSVDIYGDQWTIPNKGRLQAYTDCLRLWRNSKINLNIHQPTMRELGALNTKMYEIPAAGGFMLSDYFPEMLDKFHGDELAFYDPDEPNSLVKAVEYFMADKSLRLEVMCRARERIFKEHTAEKRAEQIIRCLS